MTEPGAPRVAVYLDFDNIVISRYDQVNGRNSFQRDKSKGLQEFPERLKRAVADALAGDTLTTIVSKVEAIGPKSFHMDLPLLENRFQFKRALEALRQHE